MKLAPPYWFSFDVESIGLFGEGFAVGYVVMDAFGTEIASHRFACEPDRAEGLPRDYVWIRAHVPVLEATHEGPSEVRRAFWARWKEWRGRGAAMLADCAWPVEARFLFDIRRDGWMDEEPYPFYDLTAFLLLAGRAPTGTYERRENELPKHDPEKDARQSARLLFEVLPSLKGAE